MTTSKKITKDMALELIMEEVKKEEKRTGRRFRGLTPGKLRKIELKLKKLGYVKGGRVEKI
jgi:hypothetical protein